MSACSCSQMPSRVATGFAACLMKVPLYSASSTTKMTTDIPRRVRFRIGKFCGVGGVGMANSEIRPRPSARICSANRWFSRG